MKSFIGDQHEGNGLSEAYVKHILKCLTSQFRIEIEPGTNPNFLAI